MNFGFQAASEPCWFCCISFDRFVTQKGDEECFYDSPLYSGFCFLYLPVPFCSFPWKCRIYDTLRHFKSGSGNKEIEKYF